jgi:hypothetical protein
MDMVEEKEEESRAIKERQLSFKLGILKVIILKCHVFVNQWNLVCFLHLMGHGHCVIIVEIKFMILS